MQTKLWKLCLSALAFTLAIAAGPRTAEACPYESWGCPDEMRECCCDRGVICVSSEWQCDQFCN